MVIIEQLYKMGQSTRRSLYHAVLILIISIENHILCESLCKDDSAELLEPVFNVLPYVRNETPRSKLVNTLQSGVNADGATRPMWPQRPLKPTQIQELPVSVQPQLSQCNPTATQTTTILQNPFKTSSNLPVVFPQTTQYYPQNIIATQERYPIQSDNLERKLSLIEPFQKIFANDDQKLFNVLNSGNNPSSSPFGETSYMFIVPSSDLPVACLEPNPSIPAQYSFLTESNVLSPIYSAPGQFPPTIYPPFVASSSNVLNSNFINPGIEVTNLLQDQSNELQVIIQPDLDDPVTKGNPVINVPYNLEIYVPVLTSLVPTSDSGLPQPPVPFFASPSFPPLMDYPPFPFPPLPVLPPIIIQGSKSKSKSNDLLKILLISRLFPSGLLGGNKCGCGNCGCGGCGYVPGPCPLPPPPFNDDILTITITTDE